MNAVHPTPAAARNWQRPRATRGTVAMFATTHSQPLTPGTFARPVVSIVFTERWSTAGA